MSAVRALVLAAALGGALMPARVALAERSGDLVMYRTYGGIGGLAAEALGAGLDGGPYTYTGAVGTLGAEVFAPMLNTRFGTAYGPHLVVETDFYSPGVWTRDDGSSGDEAPALLFMDVELELGVGLVPLARDRADLVLRFDGVLGVTRKGVAAGAEVTVRVGRVRLELLPALRAGTSWRGTAWLEQRTRAGVRFGQTHVWLDVVHGYNEDADGRADLGAFLKGGYTQVGLLLGVEMR